MRLVHPDPAAALLGLRAMKTVVTTSGPIQPAARAMLEAAQKAILHTSHDIDTLPPISANELARGFHGSALRQQFVNGMMVTSLADGVPSRETVARIEEFAGALAIDTPELADIRLFAEGHTLLAKLDFLRRGHIKDIFKNQLDQKGPLGLARSVLTMRGVMEDKALAARYRAWEKLPEGTLGRGLIDFYNRNGFFVPGERGGFPEAGLYHDFCHLLGGYGTEPEGEIQVASFTAGFKRERPFYIALFSVMIFSAGIQMRPTAADFVTMGVLGKPGVAESMLAAIERGSKVSTDLSDKWDYWAWIETPIDEVRQKLNILPKA